MGNSICLDSDFLIDLLRNKKEAAEWIKDNEENNILGTTIINLFELYSGAYRAANFENKLVAVKKLESKLKILNFSLRSAEEAGKQNALLDKKGMQIEKRDLFIGVIALSEGFSLKTNNKKHFYRIEGLRVV